MAGKFGSHLGHKTIEEEPEHEKQLPLTPVSSPPTSHSVTTPFDHRGSISTTRTSTSGWSSQREDGMESVAEEPPTVTQRIVKRPKGSYRLSDFIVQRTLGTGSFGRVHLVRSKHNLRFYAIKVLNKEKVVKLKQVEHTNNEQHVLEAVQHPFIINLWGCFQDATNLYMVMDFVPGGELFTLLRRSNRIVNGPSFIKWPAFNGLATDLILKLMESDPSKRYGNMRHGAGDVFAHPWFREVDWDKLLGREITAPYLPKINGDGDASAFDQYPEDNVAAQYGQPGVDTFGTAFPDFEYAGDMP
ncbi:hypothetical protein H0H93_008757 [Arthromyces matolae]|nr:hypothetical protein H0H93_008757 [Arthromyces matolae]